MTPELLAILITATIQIAIAVVGFAYISRILRQITASVSFHVLQGRRIEEVLRDMSHPPAA